MTPEEFEVILAALRAEPQLVKRAIAALERIAELRTDRR
jgi:hypothetical protein